ncbi:MAG: hypothetical protein OXH52_02000 [Gammaproteobacteria bacterium]|nr:hypothetical protein [Gammaproteobacteria bacterium]
MAVEGRDPAIPGLASLAKLADRARDGGDEALERLVSAAARVVRRWALVRLAHAADADDVMQEVMIRVIRSIETWPAGDLSRHVRDCPRCAAEGRRILAANEALRYVMSNGEVDAARLIERARHDATDEPRPAPRRFARAPKIAWSALAASMATATVAVVLLMQPPTLEPLPLPERPQPLVDAADYNLVVMPTRDPDITVLWFYRETEK